MHIVVAVLAVGRFIGIVGTFSSFEEVVNGIRAYEEKHLGEDVGRTQTFVLQPYHSQYGDRGEMHYIDGVMNTYVLTMDVATDWPVGVPLPDPYRPGYTMRE